MSDQFERDLRAHLQKEAARTGAFPRHLSEAIQTRISGRTGFTMFQQLAMAAALVVLAGALAFGVSQLKAFNNQGPANLPPFSCTDRSGGSSSVTGTVTGVTTGAHTGYDRVVFSFSSGVPEYRITQQGSTQFMLDPSGQTVTLQGTAGLRLALQSTDIKAGQPADLTPALGEVREIRTLGDFERLSSYGIGLSQPNCFRVFTLSSPSRLVIDFSTTAPTPAPTITPSATPTPASSASPTASASALGPFICGNSNGGSAVSANLTDVKYAPHPGYDRIVFQFDTAVPAYTITQQANAQFTQDASGRTITLSGSSGLKIVFHDASGAGYSSASGQATYTGPLDIKAGLPAVKEIRELSDYERVLWWGVGIQGSPCYRAFVLSGPARLVIDVQTST